MVTLHSYLWHICSLIYHGLYAAPQLFDLNKDNLLDLIIGVKTGELIYYENTGTTTDPQFTLVNELLGGVDVSDLTPDGYSVPNFFDFNDTTYAMVGCVDGSLKFIGDIDGHISDGDSFTYIDNSFLDLQVGAYSFFVGNSGTLTYFSSFGFLPFIFIVVTLFI